MEIFDRLESEVRSYCRSWPVVFNEARGSYIYDESGRPYLDFFAGAGSLNYGHNNPVLKSELIDYLAGDGIVHSLDAYTTAKREFLQTFGDVILGPRGLDYKVQFPGPAGNNAVEAALKLARKITGREVIVNFTNSFHGMTLGALAVTGNSMKRGGAGVPLTHVNTMPYDNYMDGETPDFLWLRSVLEDSGSGLDKPAPSSSRRCRARAVSTSPAPSGCGAWPTCARTTAFCSSSTTSRWAAAVPAASSASKRPASRRTSSRCPSPSADTASRSP